MADIPLPPDLGRIRHLTAQMHRSEDDDGVAIPAAYLLGADGDGGHNWYDPTALGGGGSPFYDVTNPAYGAVGDGTTDDTAAIIAAMDAADSTGGGVIYFPPTDDYYKITSLITRTTTSTYHLLGGGGRHAPARVHQATSNTGAFKFAPGSGTTNRDKTPLIENLAISGAGGASSGRGIEGANDLHVRNVLVAGFYDGIYLGTASFYSSIFGATITDCDNSAIHLVATNNTTIDSCRITGNWGSASGLFGNLGTGIIIECVSPTGLGTRIVNTSIEYFIGDGIYLDGGYAVLISGVYFETQSSSSGHAHIRVGPGATNFAYATRIESCYFQGDGGPGFDAIALGRAVDTVIDSCMFGVNSGIGISSTANTSNVTLNGNRNSPAGTFSLPTSSYTLDPANPPMNNPMTTAGDIIKGGVSGAAGRLAIGSNGQILTVVAGAPAWAAAAVGALDDLSDVTISSATAGQRLMFNGTVWVNDSGHDRPLMDGAGAVITDGATGEAIVAYGP